MLGHLVSKTMSRVLDHLLVIFLVLLLLTGQLLENCVEELSRNFVIGKFEMNFLV